MGVDTIKINLSYHYFFQLISYFLIMLFYQAPTNAPSQKHVVQQVTALTLILKHSATLHMTLYMIRFHGLL